MMTRLDRRRFLGGAASLAGFLSVPNLARASQSMGFDEARHLLLRTSFGPTPSDIQALASMDYAAAVDRLVGAPRRAAATPAPRWVNEGLKSVREEQREAVEKLREAKGDKKQAAGIRRPIQEQGRELRNWWVEEMLVTDQPLVERMTLFWHNHFTSSLQKVRFAPALYFQNALFRREALGNFATLLKAVARDPAMLVYLDGVRSAARQPNENFGRELLELFTLGEGHYGEADIKAAARAFTGWSIDRDTGAFVDRARQHDGGEKTFLGQTGRFGGDDIIAILLRNPRTAETIVRKLWLEFVSLTPDPDEIKRLAAVFRTGGYEIKPLMRAMLMSPAFRDPANRAGLIKSPVDLIVGTVRVLGLPVPEKTGLVRMMQGLGQVPFDPPNVKGWAGGEAWISTYTLLLRQQFVRRMVEATTVSSMEGGMTMGNGRPNRRADRKEQAPMANGASMQQLPVEGRSLRNASGEARLGPSLSGVDQAMLVRALLPRQPIDGVDLDATPGAVVASAMLDSAYQLK
ncbi:MAG: DUF1800 domain-containing protein [Proteobacteria bacterium]|nr:DUF1800 domain-containing protein [Pseudomonadota bacterium]